MSHKWKYYYRLTFIKSVKQNYETYHLAQIIDANFLKDED